MYKALLIGCGNIGALYDWDNGSVLTYAKALSLDPDFHFDVYDLDTAQASKVAVRYQAPQVNDVSDEKLKQYDLVIISSSTPTHYKYLKQLLPLNLPLLICEKPVDTHGAQLDELALLYNNSQSRVLVNFYRRFQPALSQTRGYIKELSAQDSCSHIQITYQRGLHNNGSHALDLLNFLFDEEVNLDSIQISRTDFDEFSDDATTSLNADWNGRSVHFTGLERSKFSWFEMDLFFRQHIVRMSNAGNEISFYKVPPKKEGQSFYPKPEVIRSLSGCLENYMIHVLNEAKQLLTTPQRKDNFMGSVALSKQILEIKK